MLNSVAKKIFAVGLAGSTVLMALAPFAAHAAVHAAGTNVLESNGTVAMVGTDGMLHPYTSAGAFLSYGFNSFASVVTASPEDMALSTGSFIPPQDGSIICSDRGADQGTCYFISAGQKYGFTSAAVFTGLGFSFANAKSGDVSWMTMGSSLINSSSMAHLTGTLINKGGTVYLVGANGNLLGIPDLNTFNSWGYSFNNVVPANAADTGSQTGVMAMRTAGQLSPSWTTTGSTGCTSNCNVVSGNVSVSLASDTPAAGTLVSSASTGQTGADLAHFNFSGTGTVTQVVVSRIGVSADTSVNNVYLYQGNNRITDAGSLSNGMVTFSNSNGLFTVNGSTEISVRIDVASNISGQTIGAQLSSFAVASGSPMSTSVSGNLFTIANVSNLATVQVQGTSNSAVTGPGANINAGLTNTQLWSVPISVGQRNVLLKYIAFKQIGSVSQSGIQNLKLMVDGTQVGSTASISNSGSNTNVVIFDLTGSPVTLNTGGHTLSLNGDIVSGTSYTFDFSLQTASDAVFYDTSYNVNVPLTFSNSSIVFQLNPGVTTINSGSISVQQDPTFTSTQFVTNASQVSLGQWTMKAYGEDVKVQQLKIVLNYATSSAGSVQATEGFNNLGLYVNGGQVGSSQSALYVSPACALNVCTYTFGTTNLFTVPAGTTVTVAVKGDSTFLTNTAVGSVRADLNTPQYSLQGATSYTLTPGSSSPSGVTYTGVSLTTSTSAATLTKNTGYTNQTIGSNATNQKIGSYVIQASSADGVRVTSLSVGLNATSTFNGGNLNTGLANLYIVTPGGSATPVQPAATSTFSVNFTVPANQTATVDVFADVTNATGTIVTDMTGSGLGSTSNQSVTLASPLGQTITVGNGSLNQPILQTSSPVSQFVIGGSTNQPVATFNFVATSGGATIQELDFYASSSVSGVITSVTVGGTTAPVVGATSTVTGLSIAVPTSFSGVDVPVTVNYSTVGLNGITSNVPVQLYLNRVKFLSGSQTQYSYPNLTSNTMDLVGSAPTITLTASGNTLTTGVTVGSITIAANAAGNIIATSVPFNISTNNAMATGTWQLVDASSGQVAGTAGFVVATSSSVTNQAIPLTADNNIAAGTSKTYNIVVPTVTTVSNANNYSLTVGMGAASGFSFKDVNGNVAGIPGAMNGTTFIVNYPTNTVTSHQ